MSPDSAPRKLLVMELAGLGDNIHLLPALWKIRRQWPQAQLHLMVNAHVAGLFALTPWVQQVWAYPNAPKPGVAANWRWGRRLRHEGYDCVINTNGSDRSSLLSWMTRAPRRIGRRPADGGPRGWARLFTQVVETPYHREPMYLQKLRCVQQLGIVVEPDELAAPHFEVTIDPALGRAAGIASDDDGRYIHISPFTTSPARELPLPQLAELIAGLRAAYPQLRIALSCAPAAREIEGLSALIGLLPEAPWQVWPGTLDIPALAAVIAGSALNLSGDTGSLHVALMTGARAVAWFRAHRGQDEWIPRQAGYQVLVAPDLPPREALHGIETAALLAAIAQILHRPGSTG